MSLTEKPHRLPEAESPPESPESPESREPAEPAERSTVRRLLTALVAISVVLLLVASGGLFTLAARARGETDRAAANWALTDGKATRHVLDDVGSALVEIFSYDPDDLDTTRRRAAEVLRGDAAKDYELIFATLEERARQQKLALTTYVVRAGVSELSADRARLLVFLDQRSVREGSEPTVVAAQLSVTARLDDGRWTITRLKAR
ncbi:hypothetical protein [Streptomyces sp. KLOTTS4A1]|uniref:hypothetical protein n=1 Tax=Streptomyces sp. KLOTTS4A1 TaxID=3390996 RepID=UPI0039F455C8